MVEASIKRKIVIVGAGLNGLSAILRILDENPDMYDEFSRTQFYMNERHTANIFGKFRQVRDRIQSWKTKGILSEKIQELRDKCMVIDPKNEWIQSWKSNFDAYEIPHLRSPFDIHPSPRDMRDLYAFAKNAQRTDEFTVMEHTHKKNEDYSGPYQLPGSKLFTDFCDMLVNTFGLEKILYQGKVVEIIPSNETLQSNILILESGEKIESKYVILALGPVMYKEPLFWEPPPEHSDSLIKSCELCEALLRFRKDRTYFERVKHVAIVGGGITSGHVAKIAINYGCKVTLLLRSKIKVCQFDIPTKWMGKNRGKLLDNYKKLHDPCDKFRCCSRERQGGSFSPEVYHMLQKFVNDGSLSIIENCEIDSAYWNSSLQSWTVRLDFGENFNPNAIWLCTGTDVHVNQYPLILDLIKKLPIDICCGFPEIQPDLSWCEGSKIYVMGALASLQLGPDALNLAGARHGAVIVANNIRKSEKIDQ